MNRLPVRLDRRRSRIVAPGIALAALAALVSGVSVWVHSHAVAEFQDAAVFTTSKNALVGMALLALLLFRPGGLRAAKALGRRQRALLAAIAVIGGSIPFVLFFEGLQHTTAANSAFIQKTLFIWVGLLAIPFLGERFGPGQLAAFGALFGAQLLIGRPRSWDAGTGELLILAATLLWSVEVVLARRVLVGVSASLAATARMAGGALALFAYLGATGGLRDLTAFDATQVAWLALTAAFLLAYVTTWYSALKRAPATAVTCVLTLGAPITAALQLWDGKPLPADEQLAGYAVAIAAVALLTVLALTGKRARGADTTVAKAGSTP